jgi:threonine synthase
MFGDDLPPDLIFPAGNGSLLVGVWRALLELRARGLVRRVPRIHCIQSRGCMPLAVAFARGLAEPPDLPVQPTIADGLVLQRPPRGRQVLEAVRTSGGRAVAVSDRAILTGQRLLAREEGVYAEPSAAAALAGATLLIRRGFLRPHAPALLAITGTGLKTLASAEVP